MVVQKAVDIPDKTVDIDLAGVADIAPGKAADTDLAGAVDTDLAGAADIAPAGAVDTDPVGVVDTDLAGVVDTDPAGVVDTDPAGAVYSAEVVKSVGRLQSGFHNKGRSLFRLQLQNYNDYISYLYKFI